MAAATLIAVALLGGCSGDPATTTDDGTTEPAAGESAAATEPGGEATEAADDDAQDAPSLPDACALLTQQEVADATGLPFGAGVPNDQFSSEDAVVCDWTSDDPFATAQVLVTVLGESFEDQRASVEEAFGEETVDVDLADAAYRMPDGSLVAMRAGDLFVQVSYLASGSGDVTEATLELARAALDRL